MGALSTFDQERELYEAERVPWPEHVTVPSNDEMLIGV